MQKNISILEKKQNKCNILDICCSNIQDMMIDCITRFNRGIYPLIIRTTGRNISNCIELAHHLKEEFHIVIHDISLGTCYHENVRIPEINITLQQTNAQHNLKTTTQKYTYPLSKFIEYPVYDILLDWLLYTKKELQIYDQHY